MTRKALVTGGSAGLGRAFAEALAGQGYAVTCVDRTGSELEPPCRHLNCDLANRDAVDALLAELASEGPFDTVVLNAGISATGRFERIPPAAHSALIAVNTEAPMVLCAGLARSGALQRDGKVIFISSLSHRVGYPGAASYAASKDAIAIYAKSIRKPFLRDLGVSVCCAFPGPLRTQHAERHAPEDGRAEKRMAPDVAARLILNDAAKGRAVIMPGFGAKASAVAGRLFPALTARMMRSLVYDRLDRDVW